MNTNPAFILITILQLLHALASSTSQYPAATYMPVPSDNVTVSGMESDAAIIFHNERFDPTYIKPADPRGIVVPTTTTPVATTTRLFLPVGSTYRICPAYPNGGAPENVQC